MAWLVIIIPFEPCPEDVFLNWWYSLFFNYIEKFDMLVIKFH